MPSITARANPLSAIPLGVDLSGFLDGLFYGYAVATVLFGITIVQVWIYVNTNRDNWPLRCLVGILFLLDFATTCLDSAGLHHYLVSNFGNLLNLTTITRFLVTELLITVIIVFCVEMFFASRVYLVGKFHWTVPLFIVLTAIGAFGTGIVAVVQMYKDESFTSLEDRQKRITLGFNLGLSALSDIISTIALSWAFTSSRTGIKRTDTLLQRLFQYTVTRGLSVSVDQTILLFFILIKPEKLWWMPFHLSLSKVYVITLVTMLNSRDPLQNIIRSNNIVTDTEFSGTSTGFSGITSVNNARGHINRGDVTSTDLRGDIDKGQSLYYPSPGSGKTINFSAFPRSQVGHGGKGSDGGDTFEMDDYDSSPRGVVITRETASSVI